MPPVAIYTRLAFQETVKQFSAALLLHGICNPCRNIICAPDDFELKAPQQLLIGRRNRQADVQLLINLQCKTRLVTSLMLETTSIPHQHLLSKKAIEF